MIIGYFTGLRFGAPEGSDRLTGIETIRFSDRDVAVSSNAPMPTNTLFETVGAVVPMWSVHDDAAYRLSLRELKATGANTIILDPHLTIKGGLTGTTFEWEFALSKVDSAIRLARQEGFEVWVKPLAFPDNRSLSWQALAPSNPTVWFDNYQAKLVELGSLAQQAGASRILMTNELASMTTNPAYRGDWIELIDALRKVFKGQLGVNAGGLLGEVLSTEEVANLVIGDLIDFIGISSYPRLFGPEASATTEEIRAAWHKDTTNQDLTAGIGAVIAKYNKPVYITELGSPPYLGGNAWFYAHVGDRATILERPLDVATQRAFFEGSLLELAQEFGGNLGGVFIYDWLGNSSSITDAPSLYNQFDWNLRAHQAARNAVAGLFVNPPEIAGVIETGTPGPDLLLTGLGSDVVSGGDGNDIIRTDAGNDSITGGRGTDLIQSGTGDDIVNLSANGVSATSGTLSLSVIGEILNNIAPRFTVYVNNTPIGQVQMVANEVGRYGNGQPHTAIETFTFSIANPAVISNLKITFDNEGYVSSGLDRNLKIVAVSIDGVALSKADSTYVPLYNGPEPGNWLMHQGGYLTLSPQPYLQVLATSKIDNDTLDGGLGRDVAIYDGPSSNYSLAYQSDGSWRVTDQRTGTPDGQDRLINVEIVRFSDKEVTLGIELPSETQTQFANILRASSYSPNGLSVATKVAAAQAAGMAADKVLSIVVTAADASTSVATLAYQFFTGKIPSQGGIDYLVSPTGPNPNNLNSAYYQSFNLENRYINFAVNLGKVGEGQARFAADYGGLTLAQATSKAYATIFGTAPSDAKVAALLSGGRDLYFEAYGKDGLNGLGTKAAMVGWLLAEAAKADLGLYAKANDAFLIDLADGATFAVDLIGAYGKPEFNFLG